MTSNTDFSIDQILKNRAVLGGQLFEENKTSQIHYSPSDDLINPNGVVFGGFLAAMLDDVMGMVTWKETQRPFTSVQLNVAFLSAALKDDTIIGSATVTRNGKRQAYVEGELVGKSDNKLIAKASVHQIFLNK